MRLLVGGGKRRSLATTALFSDAAVVHKRGDLPYGSREYILLLAPRDVGDSLDAVDQDGDLVVASMRAHRNILFGARLGNKPPAVSLEEWTVDAVCPALLRVAMQDASEQGEQVQAVSTLRGLCDWVATCLKESSSSSSSSDGDSTGAPPSKVLQNLQKDMDPTALEAVQAIATGIPRPGHSVVGQGTYRDGQKSWEELAKEYVALELSEEARLYQHAGGELVAIEHLADTQPSYLKSAGGAMARFFFV